MVIAWVRVVFPWSTWPIVPMFTWGLARENLVEKGAVCWIAGLLSEMAFLAMMFLICVAFFNDKC